MTVISALGGTLFLMNGFMVTAFHVFPAPLPTANAHADVIALELKEGGLKSDCRDLVIGEELTIVGYPQGEFKIDQGKYLGTQKRTGGYVAHKASYRGIPGFSGSPVLDSDFEVVGVHTHSFGKNSLFTSICEVENLIK